MFFDFQNRNTLANHDVRDFVNNGMIFWAADVQTPEGYRGKRTNHWVSDPSFIWGADFSGLCYISFGLGNLTKGCPRLNLGQLFQFLLVILCKKAGVFLLESNVYMF